MKIRRLTPKDTKKVMALNLAVWGKGPFLHSISEIKEKLSGRRNISFGAFEGGKLIGILFTDFSFKGNKVRASHFTVHPDYRKQGVMKRIHEKLVDLCITSKKRGIFLFVSKDNRSMKKVAEKLGYEKAGQSKYLYRGDREADIYFKKLFP